MNESKLFLSIKLLALTLTVCLNSASNAQDYPAKPIKMIVPYTPGGSIDNTCHLFPISQALINLKPSSRMISRRLGKLLKTQRCKLIESPPELDQAPVTNVPGNKIPLSTFWILVCPQKAMVMSSSL